MRSRNNDDLVNLCKHLGFYLYVHSHLAILNLHNSAKPNSTKRKGRSPGPLFDITASAAPAAPPELVARLAVVRPQQQGALP